MPTDVILPSQGQSVETCLILDWKVKVGEPVRQGDVICNIETDKATFDVEAPVDGTLLHIYYEAGQDAPVMTRLATIGVPGEVLAIENAPIAPPAVQQAPSDASQPARMLSGDGHPLQGLSRELRISPRARRMAELHGLDVSAIMGSGPRGRILAMDVEKAISSEPVNPQRADAPSMVVDKGVDIDEVPVRGIRKLIADRMLQSMQTTAQYTLHRTAPAAALLAYRARCKDSDERLGLRNVSVNDLLLFAVMKALRQHPEINAHFLGDRLLRYTDVHLGFAVDTPRGLMVPVIRNADALTLRALSEEARRLRTACLEEKVKPDELNGGTFTVSNLGTLGIEGFTPVLNPPQVSILGVGSIHVIPERRNGEVVFTDVINLSLTSNHQVVDGAPAARFLQTLAMLIDAIDLTLAA